MRFLVQPSPENLARLKPPVRVFLVFAALALAGLAVQRVANGGLAPETVVEFYAPGGEALPPAAVWEELHAGAFLYGFVLLMLGSLAAVCPVPARPRSLLFGAAAAAALADLFAPFAVIHLGAGAVRVATFLAAMITLASLLAIVLLTYGRTPGRGDA